MMLCNLQWDAPAEEPLDQKAIDDLIDLGKKEGDTDTKDKLDAVRPFIGCAFKPLGREIESIG